MRDPTSFPALVARAKRGDVDAVQALIVPHLPGLTGFVRLHAGKALCARLSVSDVVQSVCRRAIEGLGGVEAETEAPFKQWLFATALNRIRDLRDHHHAARRDVDRERALSFDTRVGSQDLAASYATLNTPSRQAIAKEQVERIERAFDELPDDYREVLLLARMVGLSYAELAERTGRTEGAVRQLLFRARARLATLLAREA